jgi:hypothetical protein
MNICDQIHIIADWMAGLLRRKSKVDPHNTQAQMFVGNACQYYTTARFAMQAQCLPVCGNLFHHAVEMLLKGGLARKREIAELEYMGHNLKALWRAFKRDFPNPSLERHDKTILSLNKYEDVRYPGAKGSIAMAADWFNAPSPVTTRGGLKTPKQCPLVVRDIDNLFADVFKASSWNPGVFMGTNTAALEAVTRHNDHAEFLTLRYAPERSSAK